MSVLASGRQSAPSSSVRRSSSFRNVHTLRLTALAAAVGCLTSTPLAAQERPSNQDRAGIEEVVVTARFREENIQTTPIAITAFTGDDLIQRSLENVEDIGVAVPNAFFRENVGNYGPTGTVGLRGIIQNDFSYAFEPAVAIYIDDVYHGTLSGSDMELIDLERLEVLRGPQGTLFGKNSIGGAVRLISSKPQGENTGRVELTYGRFDRLDVKGVGDFTLVEDRLFARVVGVSKRKEGYGRYLDFTCEMIRRGTPELAGIGDGIAGYELVDHDDNPETPLVAVPVLVEPGSPEDNAFSLPQHVDPRGTGDCALGSYGGQEVQAGRLMLRLLASEKVELNIAADYSHSRTEPLPQTLMTPHTPSPVSDGPYDTEVILPTFGVPYTRDDRFVTGDPYTNYATFADPIDGTYYDPVADTESWGWSGTVDYLISDSLSAKAIVAYRTYTMFWSSDTDFTPYPIQHTDYIQEHEQWQFEVQLSGTALPNRSLEWTAGLFYYDSDSRAYNTTEFGAFDYTGFLLNFVANDLYTTENKSAFVHLNYRLNERLSVSGGLRYTNEDKTNVFDHQPGLPVVGPVPFGDTRTDWKVSVDFQAADNVFLYAQTATGFRSAGYTPRIFTAGQLKPIPPEEVVTYEVGAKVDLLDRRLRINSALFYSDYDPRLVQVGATQCDPPDHPDPTPYFLAGGTCPAGTALAGSPGIPWIFFYANAPGSIEGFETELVFSPVANLNINFSAGYNTYENDVSDPADPMYRDPSALVQPEWNFSSGVQYDFMLASGARITPRLDWYHQSKRTNGPANRPNICPQHCIPSYDIFNARLTYSNANDDFSVSLSATNLTDEFYWQQRGAAVTAAGGVPSARTGVPSRPREWAITATKRF
ncbi:MAG: TonB-dependent receptor [Gammaproteobacteria bacterium]